jgi:hypothetical protein
MCLVDCVMGSGTFGLVRNQFDTGGHNFQDWQEFERSILEDLEVHSIKRSAPLRFLSSVAFRILRRAGRRLGMKPPYNLPVRSRHGLRVAILGGLSFQRCPDFILKGNKAAYLYDPTPPWASTDEVVRFVEDTGIANLFVSHPKFCEQLQPHLNRCRVHFVAEAVDPRDYLPDLEKTIDLLSFGRVLGPYHKALVEGLSPDINYQHGWLNSREDLKNAMGAARIIINFPRSLTESNMDVDMLTMRYFQSFASKALVLGRSPSLLKELFGYEPMIAADLDDPCGQIMDILSNFSSYQELVERNYTTLIEGHTFSHRWQEMKRILTHEG